MNSFRASIEVDKDRRATIVVPPEFPTGRVDVVITAVEPNGLTFRQGAKPRTSLADWARENAEHWGDEIKSTDVEGFTGRRY